MGTGWGIAHVMGPSLSQWPRALTPFHNIEFVTDTKNTLKMIMKTFVAT